MSRSPKNPWGDSGPHDDSRRALRLVEAPPVRPARPRWFPFRAAVMISAAIIGAGMLWAALRQIEAYLEAPVERVVAPVIRVESVPATEVVKERVPRREEALPVPPPAAPPVLVEASRPDWQPTVPAAKLTIDPFEIPDAWEEAGKPLLAAKEDPPAPKPAKRPAPARKPPKASSARSKPASARAAPKAERVAVRVLRQVPPVYPPSARRAGVEGRVVVQAAVGATGRVSSVSVASSSGSRVLDAAALSAVKRWSFSPERHRGKPVASEVRVPVAFQLR